MTLLAFLRNRYAVERALSIKPASIEQLRYTVDHFTRHLGRAATLADLEKLSVLGFLGARLKTVAPATVNKDRRALLALWRCAAEAELVAWPVRIQRAKCEQAVPHTFSHGEMTRLVAATARMPEHTFWRALILALFDTGARVSAMLAVRIADIDFASSTISLRPEHSKTRQGQRVSFAPDTASALTAQICGLPAESLVFPWPHHRRRLFIYFRKLCGLAAVPLPRGKAFHSLRRTHCTAVAKEFGLDIASRDLAHSSIEVTRRYIDFGQIELTNLHIANRLPRP